MTTTAEALVAKVDNLATLPAVYQQIKAVLDNPESAMADMVRVVSADPGVTARLLRMVNSVYFQAPGKIETVARALNLLGMRQVHDIVLAASVETLFKGIRPSHMDMRRFWSNSVLRGLIARAAARRIDAREGESFFVEGLLADIGHLVLYQLVPDKTEQAMVRAHQEMRPLYEVERQLIGCHYAEVGAALVEKWRLPARYGRAIALHVIPSQAEEACLLDAMLLHLARALCAGLEQDADRETLVEAIDPIVWEQSALRPEMLADIRTEAESSLAEVMELFFPST